MDLDDFRSVLESAGVDVWKLMDAAIAVASVDHDNELKRRRDGIVERLYAPAPMPRCRNCESSNGEIKKQQSSPSTEEEMDPYGDLFDDEEQKKILEIKEQLEHPHQTEDELVELLQNLADLDITFQALEETDIGRHVNRLRKHSSNDVRRLVKLLVRKWKEIVDEWVKLKTPFELERNNSTVAEPKPKSITRKEARIKLAPSPSVSTPIPATQNRQREQRESSFDSDRLASARRRLQENYKEAENAKKQRTVQVMDLHELPKPKPKNAFFGKNKGGSGSQERHW